MKNFNYILLLGLSFLLHYGLQAQSTTIGVVSLEYKCHERSPDMFSLANIDPIFMTKGALAEDFGLSYYTTVSGALKRNASSGEVKLSFTENQMAGTELAAFKGMTANAVGTTGLNEKQMKKFGIGEPDEMFYERIYAYGDELDTRYLSFILVEGTYADKKKSKKDRGERLFVGPVVVRALVFDVETLDKVFSGTAQYGVSNGKSLRPGEPVPTTSGMRTMEMSKEDADALVEQLMERMEKAVEKYQKKLAK